MKKMCVSSRSPHLFFGKLFYWRAMSLSLARLDSGRRKLSRWTPSSSCQMFKKLCLPLICTQEKKSQIPNGISKYFIHWSIYELFYSSPRKKQNWNKRRMGQMNSNFFNKKFVSSFFPVNLRGVNFLWQLKTDISEMSLKLIKSLHFRWYFPLSRNSATDIGNPMLCRCISCITSS